MSLKVVLGNIEKASPDQPRQAKGVTSAPTAPVPTAQNGQQAVQAALSRAVQSSDAVVSTLRAFKSGGAKGGQPIKDIDSAGKLAEEISDKIRENPEEAKSAHDGLSSDRGAAALT